MTCMSAKTMPKSPKCRCHGACSQTTDRDRLCERFKGLSPARKATGYFHHGGHHVAFSGNRVGADHRSIVRIMPNQPALAGVGMSAVWLRPNPPGTPTVNRPGMSPKRPGERSGSRTRI